MSDGRPSGAPGSRFKPIAGFSSEESQHATQTWDDVWAVDRYGRPSLRARRARSKLQYLHTAGLVINDATRVLDVGCGSGDLLITIDDTCRPSGHLVGCDWSSFALARASRATTHRANRVELVQADGQRLPFRDGCFDVVLAVGVLEHLTNPTAMIAESDRVLRPGGAAFFVCSNRLSAFYVQRRMRELLHLWPYGYQHNYRPGELVSLLAGHFLVDHFNIVHGAWDFPLSAACDRLLRKAFAKCGRYLLAACTKKA